MVGCRARCALPLQRHGAGLPILRLGGRSFRARGEAGQVVVEDCLYSAGADLSDSCPWGPARFHRIQMLGQQGLQKELLPGCPRLEPVGGGAQGWRGALVVGQGWRGFVTTRAELRLRACCTLHRRVLGGLQELLLPLHLCQRRLQGRQVGMCRSGSLACIHRWAQPESSCAGPLRPKGLLDRALRPDWFLRVDLGRRDASGRPRRRWWQLDRLCKLVGRGTELRRLGVPQCCRHYGWHHRRPWPRPGHGRRLLPL
mmetsp:Transcript_60776/g.130587  ORF Transcript_60776/g.130587 Transcript_60776/m.130587 type:complete len:256 (-) Transcript_60776:451-1218(-)